MAVVLAALAFFAGSCGRGSGGLEEKVDLQVAQQLQSELPALGALHSAAATMDNFQSGAAPTQSSSGFAVGPNFDGLLDSSDGGHFEWAVYSFTPGVASLQDVVVSVADPNPAAGKVDSVFIAVSDFAAGRWETGSVQSSAGQGELDVTRLLSSFGNLSPEGIVFVAVIAAPGSNIAVAGLNFRTRVNTPPIAGIEADLTSGDAPLQVELDASGSSDPDGSLVLFEWDINGDGSFESNTGAEPVNTVTYSSGGIFNPTVRVTDDSGDSDTASVEVQVTEGGNLPPVAVLLADASEGDGEAGFSVNFSSDQSSDADGSIVLYEWDLDSDTSTGTNGFELSSATPDAQQVTYSTPGEFNVRLRVTDDGGLKRIASQRIVSHGWVQVAVDSISGNQEASGFSIQVIGKFPAISYRDGEQAELVYTRSSTKQGLDPADWSSTSVTALPGIVNTALASVADRPAIAFCNVSGLIFARSTSASGEDPADWEAIKADGESGTGVAMTVVDGFPAISYRAGGAVPQRIKYVVSDVETGIDIEGWQSVVLDEGGPYAASTGLQVVAGNPAVVWMDTNAGKLLYARSATTLATDPLDWSSVAAADPAAVSQRIALEVVDGNPAVSFGFTDGVSLRTGYARSSSSLGLSAADWQPFAVDSDIATGSFSSLALVAGKPMLLYDEAAQANSLRLAVSSSASGSALADWQIEDAVPEGEGIETTARDLDMTEVDGFAAIVFFNSVTDEVTYAMRF